VRSCTSTVARAPVIEQRGEAARPLLSYPGKLRVDKVVVQLEATRMFRRLSTIR